MFISSVTPFPCLKYFMSNHFFYNLFYFHLWAHTIWESDYCLRQTSSVQDQFDNVSVFNNPASCLSLILRNTDALNISGFLSHHQNNSLQNTHLKKHRSYPYLSLHVCKKQLLLKKKVFINLFAHRTNLRSDASLIVFWHWPICRIWLSDIFGSRESWTARFKRVERSA